MTPNTQIQGDVTIERYLMSKTDDLIKTLSTVNKIKWQTQVEMKTIA